MTCPELSVFSSPANAILLLIKGNRKSPSPLNVVETINGREAVKESIVRRDERWWWIADAANEFSSLPEEEEEEVEDALHEEMTENRLLPPLPFNLVALVKTAVNNGVDSVWNIIRRVNTRLKVREELYFFVMLLCKWYSKNDKNEIKTQVVTAKSTRGKFPQSAWRGGCIWTRDDKQLNKGTVLYSFKTCIYEFSSTALSTFRARWTSQYTPLRELPLLSVFFPVFSRKHPFS